MSCRNCSSSCACAVEGEGGITVTGTGAGLTPYVVSLSVVSPLTTGVDGIGFDVTELATPDAWPWAGEQSNGIPLYWDATNTRLVTSPDSFVSVPAATATAQTATSVTQTPGTVTTLGSAITPTFTNDSVARDMELLMYYFSEFFDTSFTTTGCSFTVGVNLDTGSGSSFIPGHVVTCLSGQTRFSASSGMAYFRKTVPAGTDFTPSMEAAVLWNFGSASSLAITATPTIQFIGGTS